VRKIRIKRAIKKVKEKGSYSSSIKKVKEKGAKAACPSEGKGLTYKKTYNICVLVLLLCSKYCSALLPRGVIAL